MSTGIRRLDALLGGGLPRGTLTLLHGGPFTGKAVVRRFFFLQGLRSRQPGILVLSDSDARETERHLGHIEPGFRDLARNDLATYVDAYTRAIGGSEDHPASIYLDGCEKLEPILQTVQAQVRRLQQEGPREYRLVLQSVSTLLIEAGSQEVYRFLRVLGGFLRRTGGTGLMVLEAGMHPESEVETIKHLAAGMIQTKEMDDKFYLRADGLRTAFRPGWIEYEFTPTQFELVGSFASERIRSTVAT